MAPALTLAAPISQGKVDSLLVKTGKANKVFLRRRIEFREATQADEKMDLLRRKYKPINEAAADTNGSADKSKMQRKSSTHQNGAANGLVDPSGFRRAAHQLFPPDRLPAGWRTVRPIGPGLSNLGNTCFLNSVLQCLTYTAPLAEYMLSREHSAGCRAGDSCMLCRFEAHVVRALSKREGHSSSIAPKSIVGRLKLVSKSMRIGRQEDAHEFLRCLVDAFQRSLMHGIDPKIDRRIQESSLVHQIFGGYLQSQVTCSRCDHDSNTFDPLLDLSLDIQSGSTIAKALRAFTRPEHLVKSNRYKCDKCKRLVDASKQMTVYQLPRILTLQLKRFSVFGGGKINRFVEFPTRLSLKHFVSRNSPEPGPYDYSLYAVLVHSGGTSRSGHYYCFVKSPAGVWYELNDSSVHQVSERTVLKQSAYLLFYERAPSAAAPSKMPKSHAKKETDHKQDHHKSHHSSNASHHSTPNPLKIATADDEMESELQKDAERQQRQDSQNNTKSKRKNKNKKQRKKHRMDLKDAILGSSSNAAPDHPMKKELDSSGLHTANGNSSTSNGEEPRVAAEKSAASIEAKLSKSGSDNWVVREKAPAATHTQAKASAVQVISWDEENSSKRAKLVSIAEGQSGDNSSSWSVASVRADRKSQYGAAVKSWAGTEPPPSDAQDMHKSSKKNKRRPDKWNTEYDRGRVKKVKKNKNRVFSSTINPYQMLSERQGKK